MNDVPAPTMGLSTQSRDDIKSSCLFIGMILQPIAKRTANKVDDKFATLLIAAGTTDTAALDKVIDLFDNTK